MQIEQDLRDKWIDAEVCFSSSWEDCGNISYARFAALPHVGEAIQLPNRSGASIFRVMDLRHVPAVPGGAGPKVRIRVEPEVAPAGRPKN